MAAAGKKCVDASETPNPNVSTTVGQAPEPSSLHQTQILMNDGLVEYTRQLGQIEVRPHSHHKWSVSKFECSLTKTTPSSWSPYSCFGAHLSITVVFTLVQMNCTWARSLTEPKHCQLENILRD